MSESREATITLANKAGSKISKVTPKQFAFLDVERHIKYTKKIKLNARRHNVKFRSIQII